MLTLLKKLITKPETNKNRHETSIIVNHTSVCLNK
jgi:hypothetical protein